MNANSIAYYNVTSDDITRAEFIYGQAHPLLQGKTTKTSYRLRAPSTTLALPPPIAKFHRDTDLFVAFPFVNKVPFLHTKSKNINFLTV